jgi:hypothetical protein
MSATRDRLDAAIDQVAARLVAVPDDGEMTLRIVSALPERTSRLRWLLPQFAAIGALAIAALVWTTRNSTAPAVTTLPSSAVASITGFANGVVADEPGTVLRTMSLERLELLGRMEPTVPEASGDHERALPAIEALGVLSVAETETTEIALPASIGLASIDIADLKLTAESFTTQKEE